ncbi:MAG TPA: BF3164 family lipoprotein [Macellibacteroides fermentans]|uniref:BF3164 family lipoprotein n=1 Tax=Macellibacteroides fermentans TaxID=879969 RepID=UPI002C516157|nr:BF3164 family lipoprotein [Macellibacteroides fermentans]
MKDQISILFLLITFLSCEDRAQSRFPHYQTFPQEKILEAKALSLDTALFRYPFRIEIRGRFALIMDIHNIDNYYHLFNYPAMTHIVSFGHRGDSPGDMLSADSFAFQSLDSIWTLDANKMQITRWEITNRDYTVKMVECISLNKKIGRALDFIRIGNDFVIPDYLAKSRYNLVNSYGEIFSEKGIIPSEQYESENLTPALAQAWRSFIDFNSKNGILSLVTQLGEVVEIYNLQNNTHKVLYGPNGEPDFKISNDYGIPTGIMGFSDVEVTDKYIYTVFHGRSFKEIARKIMKGVPSIDGGRYIYVFSLTGEPVCSYVLDRYIYGIDVNEEKGIITAVDVNSDEPIVQFKI